MASVQLVNLKKVYPFVSGEGTKKKKKKKGEDPAKEKVNLQITDEGVVAVQEFNLDIADKEFIVLVGPSGCGKSTTLRMVAGLEEISGGELYIDGEIVNHVAPKDRDIAMVFQNYALYPHMTVYDNMAFSLKLKHEKKDVIREKVLKAAEMLDIVEYLDRKPKALSGGQRQRVAIGRAIVREPKVMLMDEPLSNLDAKLRNQMRAEIIKLREQIDTTFIYVTHDQTEAMTLGDRIVVMKDGYIQQIGTPQEVFNHPANLFVAGFIGMPVMNFFDAELIREKDRYFVSLDGHKVELSAEKQARLKANNVQSQSVTLGVRPEHVDLAETGVDAKVDVSEMMGSSVHLHLRVDDRDMIMIVPTVDMQSIPHMGDAIRFSFNGKVAHLFSKETGENLEFDGEVPAQIQDDDEAPVTKFDGDAEPEEEKTWFKKAEKRLMPKQGPELYGLGKAWFLLLSKLVMLLAAGWYIFNGIRLFNWSFFDSMFKRSETMEKTGKILSTVLSEGGKSGWHSIFGVVFILMGLAALAFVCLSFVKMPAKLLKFAGLLFIAYAVLEFLVLILARKDAFALGIRQSNNPIGAGLSALDMAVNVVIGLFTFFAFRKVTDGED